MSVGSEVAKFPDGPKQTALQILPMYYTFATCLRDADMRPGEWKILDC